ncbi:MAG: Dabb family protein [Planctomycetales bacterium]
MSHRPLFSKRLALMTLATTLLSLPIDAAEPELKQGERIVFLGDSITQAGAGPGGYVTLVKEALATQRKDLGIEVIGAGISGNRVPDLEKRLEKDVLARKPTLVVIYIGINDVWHSQNGKGTSKADFEGGLRRIIKQIQEGGARVVLCTTSVIGERLDSANPLDPMLDDYCEISRKVAGDTKSQLLDLRRQFLLHLKQHNPQNAEKDILTTDGVHLNAAGNRFVAQRVLQALGVRPGRALRHTVLFKFKAEVTEPQVQEVIDAFAALKGKISEIQDFEWGTDVSVENLASGFTHAFFVSFKDEAARDAYLPHPAHQEFVKLAGPRIDKVLVVDYWAR